MWKAQSAGTTDKWHHDQIKGIFFCFCFFEIGFLCTVSAVLELAWCRPGWLQTHRDPPASAFASQVLGLKPPLLSLIMFINTHTPFIFEIGSHHLVLAVLEFLIYRSGWSQTQRPTWLCLLSAGSKGVVPCWASSLFSEGWIWWEGHSNLAAELLCG